MGLRNQLKRLLWRCGRPILGTVHERLNNVDRQLADILDQNTHLAENQTALLRSGIYLVENLPELQVHVQQLQADVQNVEVRLASLLREHCAAKPDLEALAGRVERLRRDLYHSLASFWTPDGQTWAVQVEASGEDLPGIMRQTAAAIRQMFEDAMEAARVSTADLGPPKQEYALLRERIASLEAVTRETRAFIEQETVPSTASLARLEQECALLRERIASLEPVTHETRASVEGTRAFIEQETVRQVCVETSDYASMNPEVELVSFLYSYLPGRKAMDIGAHVGEVSEGLLKAGYEVYAFEPYPPSYTQLTGRLNGRTAFHPFNLALGAVEGELPLHLVTDRTSDRTYDDPTLFHSLSRHGMPEGLAFRETVPVPVRKLASLHRDGIVPAEISYVKVDTEGYDLEVVKGMEDYRYPVVSVEFWDTQIPFARSGLLYTAETMVREMQRRDYFWYIVLYRVWGRNQIAYFCNHDRPVPGSWGNLFFFRDPGTFQHAQQWCSAVLPRTYFKPVAATQNAGRV